MASYTFLFAYAILLVHAQTNIPEASTESACVSTCGECYDGCSNSSQYDAHSQWTALQSGGYQCLCLDGPQSGATCTSPEATAGCSTSCSSFGQNCLACDSEVCTQCTFGFTGFSCEIEADFNDYCNQKGMLEADACQCYSFDDVSSCSSPSASLVSSAVINNDIDLSLLQPLFILGSSNSALLPAVTTTVQSWLMSQGPVVAQVDVGSQFNPNQCVGGQATMSCNDCNGATDHAITIVGWATVNGSPSWIIQNSWGLTSGDDGFFYIAFDDLGTASGQFNVIGLVGIQYGGSPSLGFVAESIPETFNWAATGYYGNVSSTCAYPIQNQQQCGSCYAFSSSAVVSMTYCNLMGSLLVVSPQYALNMYFNFLNDNGYSQDPCDGGEPYWVVDVLTNASISGYATCADGCSSGCLPYFEGNCFEATDTAVAPSHVGTTGATNSTFFASASWDIDAASSIYPANVVLPGGLEAMQQSDASAAHALNSFVSLWQQNYTNADHQLLQVYSIHRQVVNGIIYRMKLVFSYPSDGKKKPYLLHATSWHKIGDSFFHLLRFQTDLSIPQSTATPSPSSGGSSSALAIGLSVGIVGAAIFGLAAFVAVQRARLAGNEAQQPYRVRLMPLDGAEENL